MNKKELYKMAQAYSKAAMQELNSSYAIIVDGNLAYQRQAMLNMFRKGAEWQAKQSPWVSLNDRLPEVGEKIIVVTKNHKYLLTEMYIPKDCKGNILGEKEWHVSSAVRDSIVAWMNIPKFEKNDNK